MIYTARYFPLLHGNVTQLEESNSEEEKKRTRVEMYFFTLLKTLASRTVFFIHGMLCIYLLYTSDGKRGLYWLLMAPLGFLLVEMVFVLIYRNGSEFKYFLPSAFFYMSAVLPVIWIFELKIRQSRLNLLTNLNQTSHEVNLYWVNLNLSSEFVGKKFCELGLLIGLVVGRWLMPRGVISRDQLSALLLGYVGNAADILDLFEAFEEPAVYKNKAITQAVLGVYTWSIYQFTLVTTATLETSPLIGDHEKVGRGSKVHDVEVARTQQKGTNSKEHKGLHGELFNIIITLIMQDAPFFILRLILMFKYDVVSEMHVFFTCKNAIVIVLLVYRLCVLLCCNESSADAEELRETPVKQTSQPSRLLVREKDNNGNDD